MSRTKILIIIISVVVFVVSSLFVLSVFVTRGQTLADKLSSKSGITGLLSKSDYTFSVFNVDLHPDDLKNIKADCAPIQLAKSDIEFGLSAYLCKNFNETIKSAFIFFFKEKLLDVTFTFKSTADYYAMKSKFGDSPTATGLCRFASTPCSEFNAKIGSYFVRDDMEPPSCSDSLGSWYLEAWRKGNSVFELLSIDVGTAGTAFPCGALLTNIHTQDLFISKSNELEKEKARRAGY